MATKRKTVAKDESAKQDPIPDAPKSPGALLSRPVIYPHEPRNRESMLEKFYGEDLLDNLRTTHFDGFFNLAVMVLFFLLLYVTVRNVMEKGLYIPLKPALCSTTLNDMKVSGFYLGSVYFAAFLLYFGLKLHINHLLKWYLYAGVYAIVQFVFLVCIPVAVFNEPLAPPYSMGLMMVVIVVSMKSHSYFATNFYLEQERRKQKKSNGSVKPAEKSVPSNEVSNIRPGVTLRRVQFPDNVTLRDFSYFIFGAVTLVYELNYPRNDRIRKRYVISKYSMALICLVLQYLLLAQFVLPVVTTKQQNPVWYDVMKLAVPNFLIWLLGFFGFFHCILNGSAELFRFADREFYQDWWNATTIGVFWRKWNIPVHEWCLRHVMVESVYYYKVSRFMATLLTFFWSAVLHELMFSVMVKQLKTGFFFGMMGQFPMVIYSDRFKGQRRGNLIMWLSLFLGQPLLEILYLRDYFQVNQGFFCRAQL